MTPEITFNLIGLGAIWICLLGLVVAGFLHLLESEGYFAQRRQAKLRARRYARRNAIRRKYRNA